MNFADRLVEAIEKKGSCSVVGLDPDLAQLPPQLKNGTEASGGPARRRRALALLEFGKRVIDVVSPLVPAVKPQVAFYERLGWEGFRAYEQTIAYAHRKGLIVIGDVKRGDIGSTAQAYAYGHLGGDPEASSRRTHFPDAITVNPLFGSDGVAPFVKQATEQGRGVFVLVRTSNPSSSEVQGEGCGEGALSRSLAEKVARWGADSIGSRGYSAVGAVVGATFPDDARALRRIMPRAFFLVPGYGAQGAGAAEAAPSFNEDGLGAVVNSSRGIIFAWRSSPWRETYGPARWEEAVEAATKKMNEDLRHLLRPAGR